MSLVQWVSQLFRRHDSISIEDPAYKRAMELSDSVIEHIKERAEASHPFRGVLAQMLVQSIPRDTAVIADAFEVMQESRIFHGLNGKEKSSRG